MSTADQVRSILGGTIKAYRGDPAYRNRPDVHNELDRIGRRLNQPIRIALAGTLKAGKSTLVNALVGEDIDSHRRHRGHPHRHVVPARSHAEGDRQPPRRSPFQCADRA